MLTIWKTLRIGADHPRVAHNFPPLLHRGIILYLYVLRDAVAELGYEGYQDGIIRFNRTQIHKDCRSRVVMLLPPSRSLRINKLSLP